MNACGGDVIVALMMSCDVNHLSLIALEVEEVGGDGDQEDQHPHNHLKIASGSGLGKKSIETEFSLCGISP